MIDFKITNAGLNAALDAEAGGLIMKIKTIRVGSGRYIPVVDDPHTNLEAPFASAMFVGGDVEPNSHTLRFNCSLRDTENREVYEIGLFSEENVLFAVASTTGEPFFLTSKTLVTVFIGGLKLGAFDSGVIQLVLDPNGSLALHLFGAHEAHADPHPQYVLKTGLLPYLKALGDVIWHVGSWHGSDNLSYDPSIALLPIFGYATNWELRPHAPYGVTALANPLEVLTQFKAEAGALNASTTRIWRRLHDKFNCVISADTSLIFQKDKVTFTLVADEVPDGTVVVYELMGTGIVPADFRETEKKKTLQGQLTFMGNQAQITLTRNTIESINGEFYADPNFVDSRDFKLKLIGVDSESPKVTLPVVYAGLSEIEFTSNGDGSPVPTHFVVATRGVPIGTECTVSYALQSTPTVETFTIDETGRHIVEIPRNNIDFSLSGSANLLNFVEFTVSLEMLGKKWYDKGIAHRIANNHTEMRFGAPTMPLSLARLDNGYMQIMDDREFEDRGLTYTATFNGSLPGKSVLSSNEYVMARNEGNVVNVLRKTTGGKKGQFAVHLIGAKQNTGDLLGIYTAYARLLVYVE